MAKSGATSNVAASKAGTKPDASRMWQEIVRAEQRMPDDGAGRIEIWTVDKVTRGAEATKTALPQAQYGQFFSKNRCDDVVLLFIVFLLPHRRAVILTY